MPISWNEIRHNAIKFSKEWAGETREEAEGKSFWDEFFDVFGIRRRTVASFEEPVKNLGGQYGYIDLFWPGMLLVEHKSFGKDLGRAESQAMRYVQDLAREGREKEAPRYIIVSDFARLALHDLETGASLTFPLAEFHKRIHSFAFIPGYKQHSFEDQDPINIEATEMLGQLHDALEAGGYVGHDLERFLVRILFCLFAEDTGIFEREAFHLYLLNHTKEDGSDLGQHLAHLFNVLNTAKRQENLNEDLAHFPYVNGDLFGEHLGFADFNRDMRNALVAATRFDWSRISPAIFGSLFQTIMEPKDRRQIGAHYTSERDILKVVRSLFLDDLRAEFESRKKDRSTARSKRLEEFHEKLSALNFLDPACGCGNFLIITYRELRLLELEILKELFGGQKELTLDEVNRVSRVDVDQFYGIEISEWPARIAEVALWLMDHQMNLLISEAFGQLYQRLPLKKSPHIHVGNALRMDWKTVLIPEKCSFILGNPPFIGQTFQNPQQKSDQMLVLSNIKACGVLDYVTNWYVKAASFIQGTKIIVGLVSTNSIVQGEQAGILWTELFSKYRLKIVFAHTTFPWISEAKGKAQVHVVIVGFSAFDAVSKKIYDYNNETQTSTFTSVKNISPYLIEGSDVVVTNKSSPICNVPRMSWGNKPTDGGRFLLSPEERKEILRDSPDAQKFIRPYMGGSDFLNGNKRFCLWLLDISPAELRSNAKIMERVEGVRHFRNESKAASTRAYAQYPTRFRQIAQPDSDYLAIPEVSSENRKYIPTAFISKSVICSNTVQFIPQANLFHFGVITSVMHMAWVRQVCGRLKSDFRYSNSLVYNNFPWPENASEKQKQTVELKAQAVLEARKQFPDATLADLYDPLAMPPALSKAHNELDLAVDLCYRSEKFESDRQRVEYLFALYEKLTAPLLPAEKKKRKTSNS